MIKNKLYIGYLLALVHFFIEVICFAILKREYRIQEYTVYVALIFDFFAFVPQYIFGMILDKNKKIRLDIIAIGIMMLSLLMYQITSFKIVPLILLCLGNAILHEISAVISVRVSNGKLSHNAIFVAGGSFGVVTGQWLGEQNYSNLTCYIALGAIAMIVFFVSKQTKSYLKVPEFDLVNDKYGMNIIVIIVLMIVSVRSFLAYAIPIGWKKEMWQSFLLFFVMGFGKALGGILSDRFGARVVGVLSTLLCIPFLIFGDERMAVSVIGVFMFSMTMPITYGMLLSVIKNQPGLAFGITTIGLFLGLFITMITGLPSKNVNIVLITILSLSSSLCLFKTLNGKN